MTKEPLVSVIIPFFNRIDLTMKAIKSVLGQTHKNYEIILIDDGSKENIKKRIKKLDPRIKYFRQNNRGPASARNLGLKHSSGKYVAFLDSDDIFLPNKIKTQVLIMEKNPRIVLSYTNYSYINFLGNKIIKIKNKISSNKYPWIVFRCLIATPTVMINRKLLKDFSFNEKLMIGEDVVLWAKIAKKNRILKISNVLTYVRKHKNQAASASFHFKIIALINIIDIIKKDEKNKFYQLIFFLVRTGLTICKKY